MTAEIAILNRQAVALAADSAVTIGRQKVWRTANKLFSLSPANDIGIMIYGSGDFIDYSWEIVVKTFREQIGDDSFATVSACAREFVEYLKSNKFQNVVPPDWNVISLFYEVLDVVGRDVGDHSTRRGYREKLTQVIEEHVEYVRTECKQIPGCMEKKQFLEDYSKEIEEAIENTFKQPLTKKLIKRTADLLYMAAMSEIPSSRSTGVVIAGYGSDQFFPELVDYRVDGKPREYLRAWVVQQIDLNDRRAQGASVVPFAQADMSQIFMEGIAHTHRTFIHKTLIQVLNDKSDRLVKKLATDAGTRRSERASQKKENEQILRDFMNEFSDYIGTQMIQPVMGVIATLPKEEMAAMAEALVEITTLRRKVDSTVESVGGPTDVAVISKGDGLVWIKRKRYFDSEINPDFHQRKRFRRGGGHATQREG